MIVQLKMKIMLKYFQFIFLLVLTFGASAQEKPLISVSGNSYYAATCHYAGKTKDSIKIVKQNKTKTKVVQYHLSIINIYQVRTKKWIHSLKFKSKRKDPVEEIMLSYDGKILYARSKNEHKVWDVLSGRLLKDFEEITKLALASQNGFFVVLKNNKLTAYDSYKGEKIVSYNVSRSSSLINVSISRNDKYIVAATDEKLIFYKGFEKKIQKKIKGFDYRINEKGDQLTVLRRNEDRFYVYLYELPDFRSSLSINSAKILRDQQKRNNYKDEFTLHFDKCSLSPYGKYLVLFAERERLKIKHLFVVDIETAYPDLHIGKQKSTVENYLYPYSWQNEKLIIVQESNMIANVYNLETGRNVIGLSYQFFYDDVELTVSDERQLKERQISPNCRYILLKDQHRDSVILYAQPTAIKQKKSTIKNVQFLAYSPDSKYIFIKNKDNRYGYFKTASIETDIGDSTTVEYQLFDNFISKVTPEEIIKNDAIPPDGYLHLPLKDFFHISRVPKNDLVNLYFKTLEINQNIVGIQVHLLDKNGNYYYGASEYHWKHIWCRLWLQSKTGDIRNVKNFSVRESTSLDSKANAVVIVMDHSGSMGDKRAKELQQGAENFINKKAENDAIALVKYDTKVGVEKTLTTDKEQLLKSLQKTGLKGYGESTSLLDAIDRSIAILRNSNGYARKSIVILTDGNENSSIVSKGEVLKNAKENNINIFTIGFGDFVSEEYLKAIAYLTEGSFYHIYKTDDFDWIFNDIYNRMRNYYTISFATDSIGEYTAGIKICLDKNRTDSMVTVFTNQTVDFDKMIENPDMPLTSPVIYYSEPVIKEYTPPLIDTTLQTKPEDTTEIIEKEFKEINFPQIQFNFDNTQIVEDSDKGLEAVIEFMKKYPEVVIEVSGHTDSLGENEQNEKLSAQRAKVVKKKMLQAGIKSKRIIAVGYGESRPIANNNTEAGRAKNRRVEFRIIEK